MTTSQIPRASSPTPSIPLPTPVAWIGLDWGHRSHAFALQDASGHQEEGLVEHSAESLHHWLGQLAERFGSRPVALAIEATRGAVIHALVQYPWLTIYPIHPATSARYRHAFTPSGAKDDLPDARTLRELVRVHADRLRPLETQDPQTIELEGLTQVRRDLVDRRTQVLNQLTSLLRSYYPQALSLLGNLDTQLAIDFLRRWPDLITLKAASPQEITRFYYLAHLRRPATLQKRLEFIAQAVALTTEAARVSVAVLQLNCLLDQLQVLRCHIARIAGQTHDLFAKHPEARLFRDLPGAGPALAPRLCAAFGTIRALYPTAASLQQLAGVAPVREKSGRQLWTHWRWLAPRFLRQTFVEWAGQTVVYSSWARTYYQHRVAQGQRHHVILRALAFKWIRILWKCWQTQQPYDETKYLEALSRRHSPHAVAS